MVYLTFTNGYLDYSSVFTIINTPIKIILVFTFLYIIFIVSPGQVFSKIRVDVSLRVFNILLHVSLKGSTARLPLAFYECPCSPCFCQHSRLYSLKIFANLVRKEYFPLLFKLWGKSIFNFFSLLVRLKYTYTYTHPHCISLNTQFVSLVCFPIYYLFSLTSLLRLLISYKCCMFPPLSYI